MNKFKLFLKTSRPAFWIVGPTVLLGGAVLGHADFSWLLILELLLMTFPFSLFLYGLNDIYDYESDKTNPRKNSFQGIILEPRYHKLIFRYGLLSAVAILLVAILSLNWQHILFTALFLFLCYAYSTPPFRFKAKAPLDSIIFALSFLAAFFMGFSLGDSIVNAPLKIYYVTIMVLVLHSASTIIDYEQDKRVGDKTVAVRFGKRNTAIFVAIVSLLILVFAHIQTLLINIIIILSIIMAIIIAIKPDEKLARRLMISIVAYSVLLALGLTIARILGFY